MAAGANWNWNISAKEQPILRKFDTVMRLCTLDTVSKWKFTISKIQDGGSRHFEQVALLWQRDRATRLSVEILQLQNIPFEN